MYPLEAFLKEALKQEAKVDLQLVSGHTFEAVLVTGLLHGTVEVSKVVNKKPKVWVMSIAHVIWGSVA